jgi:hypothetical protein
VRTLVAAQTTVAISQAAAPTPVVREGPCWTAPATWQSQAGGDHAAASFAPVLTLREVAVTSVMQMVPELHPVHSGQPVIEMSSR